MTELQKLKEKCYKKDGSRKAGATDADFARLKQLQDGEPLSKADLENAKKREEERVAKDKADYAARQQAKIDTAASKAVATVLGAPEEQDAKAKMPTDVFNEARPQCITIDDQAEGMKAMAMSAPAGASLNPPPDHPRIVELKDALRVFTQIEAHDSRPDEFVLFTREVSITAGDVRRARRAMKI